jgi:hypothetical protein
VNNQGFLDLDPELSAPGELARKANVSETGFSVSRWLFWRQRFKELSRCGDEQVAREGKSGFSWMINTGREMGYDIAGESNYAAKVGDALLAELRRSGKNCVSSEEIVIDLGWQTEGGVLALGSENVCITTSITPFWKVLHVSFIAIAFELYSAVEARERYGSDCIDRQVTLIGLCCSARDVRVLPMQ